MALFPVSQSSRSSFGTSTRAGSVGVLSPEAKSVVLLTAGNISVKTGSGPTLVFTGLPAGYVIPFVVTEIVALSGGATAATIDA
jgi:hypothetical protein